MTLTQLLPPSLSQRETATPLGLVWGEPLLFRLTGLRERPLPEVTVRVPSQPDRCVAFANQLQW